MLSPDNSAPGHQLDSDGLLPTFRSEPIRFSASNQNGAPSAAAAAVRSRPISFRLRVLTLDVACCQRASVQPTGSWSCSRSSTLSGTQSDAVGWSPATGWHSSSLEAAARTAARRYRCREIVTPRECRY